MVSAKLFAVSPALIYESPVPSAVVPVHPTRPNLTARSIREHGPAQRKKNQQPDPDGVRNFVEGFRSVSVGSA